MWWRGMNVSIEMTSISSFELLHNLTIRWSRRVLWGLLRLDGRLWSLKRLIESGVGMRWEVELGWSWETASGLVRVAWWIEKCGKNVVKMWCFVWLWYSYLLKSPLNNPNPLFYLFCFSFCLLYSFRHRSIALNCQVNWCRFKLKSLTNSLT